MGEFPLLKVLSAQMISNCPPIINANAVHDMIQENLKKEQDSECDD
jgi:hypothetical protein